MKLPYAIYASAVHHAYPHERNYVWDWVGTTELEADEDHHCTENLTDLIPYILSHLSLGFQTSTIYTFVLEYWDSSKHTSLFHDRSSHILDIYSMEDGEFLYRIYCYDEEPEEEIYQDRFHRNEEDIINYYRELDGGDNLL